MLTDHKLRRIPGIPAIVRRARMCAVDLTFARELIEHHAAAMPGLPPPAGGSASDGDVPRVDRVRVVNPTCGDVVDLTLTTTNGTVRLTGTASGCSLSRAAASMLGEALEGRPPADALILARELVQAREAGRTTAVDADVAVLTDLPVAPLRRRCILLPWRAAAQVLAAVMDASHATAPRRGPKGDIGLRLPDRPS